MYRKVKQWLWSAAVVQVKRQLQIRKNRLTPEAIWQMLKAFSEQKNLLHGEKGILYKTGTLHGVSTLAGYLPGSKQRYFVILLNQPKNRRNEILKLLLATDFTG